MENAQCQTLWAWRRSFLGDICSSRESWIWGLGRITWRESIPLCQSTWSSSPCHPSDYARPNLSSKKLQKSLQKVFKIFFSRFTSWSVVLIKRKLGSHFSTLLKADDLNLFYMRYVKKYIFSWNEHLCGRFVLPCVKGCQWRAMLVTWISWEKTCLSNCDHWLKST